MRFGTMATAAISAAILAAIQATPAHALQPIDNAWNLCAAHTQAQERQLGIPRHLLTAISLAESGKWDKSRRAIFAWPWTVTVFGKGRFYDSKAEALADVEVLRGQGVTNIDVGCMQINLHFHGDAFASLSEALEPKNNTAYGADFLKRLYDEKRSWTLAAGRYHSATPDRGQYYRRKVTRLWAKLKGISEDLIARVDGRKLPPTQSPGDPSGTISSAEVRVDRIRQLPAAARYIDDARTQQLNGSLAKRRAAAATVATGANGQARKDTRRQQLAAWRNARSRPEALKHLVALRTAELQRKRKDEIKQLMTFDRDKAFAQRRQNQMKSWRKHRYVLTPPVPTAATPIIPAADPS